MKINNSKYIIAFLAMTMVFMSCKKVFEDITQYKSLTPDAVWTDVDYTTQYINKFYALLYTDLTKTDAPATDEFGIDQHRTWTRFNTDANSFGKEDETTVCYGKRVSQCWPVDVA